MVPKGSTYLFKSIIVGKRESPGHLEARAGEAYWYPRAQAGLGVDFGL